ncbi:hypothetical protein CHCC4186_1824 [Bacillus paralicheniformis]|nr:hypothetical protein CHCC4186_1824 [Bacillus paralicheniformis]
MMADVTDIVGSHIAIRHMTDNMDILSSRPFGMSFYLHAPDVSFRIAIQYPGVL